MALTRRELLAGAVGTAATAPAWVGQRGGPKGPRPPRDPRAGPVGPAAPARAAAAAAAPFSFVALGDTHFDRPDHHDMSWLERDHHGDVNQVKHYCKHTAE